jgi:hypothetical protein
MRLVSFQVINQSLIIQFRGQRDAQSELAAVGQGVSSQVATLNWYSEIRSFTTSARLSPIVGPALQLGELVAERLSSASRVSDRATFKLSHQV